MELKYVLADATPWEEKEFDSISYSFFTYLGKDLNIGEKLCFDTENGILWYKVVGKIVLAAKNANPNYIIQLNKI